MRLTKSPLAWALLLLTLALPVRSEETEEEAKPAVEYPSPDQRFAFRYQAASEFEGKCYNLIRKLTGEALTRVLQSDVDPAASARFGLEVLWRPDSKAFALTATLWKRGSYVAVYLRDGTTFREVDLPELTADIPDSVTKGKAYPHIAELNSQSAKRWRKDGSLVVEIENMQDGNGDSITANRTVILEVKPVGRTKILKSTIKFTTAQD